MGTLNDATNLSAAIDDFTVELDPEWEVWGPAGGYLAAIALRAAERVVPPGHRPVTLQAQFLARAESGSAKVRAEVCKPGRTALVNVALSQSDRDFFQAQIWTTSKSSGPRSCRLTMPSVPAPDELETLEKHFSRLGRSFAKFWSKFDCRPIEFRVPGGKPAQNDSLERWFRYRNETPPRNTFEQASRAAVLIDANVWAAHCRLLDKEPDYAGPSLDLSVWFHDLAHSSDWMLLEATSPVANDGVVHGGGSVWAADGRLIATGGSNCLVVPLKTNL
jgi:acyl-CoA thioesterase-2